MEPFRTPSHATQEIKPDLIDGQLDQNVLLLHKKLIMFEIMLNQIANFCLINLQRTIVKDSTSINSVWNQIKLHFDFQTIGANFKDFVSI